MDSSIHVRTVAYVGTRVPGKASCQSHSWWSLNYIADDVGLQLS